MDRQAQDKKASAKFLKVLVAIDGSEESFRAAKYAVELAKIHNAKLIALAVNPFPTLFNIDKSSSFTSCGYAYAAIAVFLLSFSSAVFFLIAMVHLHMPTAHCLIVTSG